jgi:hypothetical protein
MNLDLPAVVGASEELGDAGSGGEADHDHDSEAPIASNVGAASDQAHERRRLIRLLRPPQKEQRQGLMYQTTCQPLAP